MTISESPPPFGKCSKCLRNDIEIVETSYCEGCQEEEDNCTCTRVSA